VVEGHGLHSNQYIPCAYRRLGTLGELQDMLITMLVENHRLHAFLGFLAGPLTPSV
jgi:hypothetical protein